MPEPTKYRPVFHLADAKLFERFVEKIPRSSLITHLRGDEALRNRNFPGFRISDTTPTQTQIVTAYRKEILQRANKVLANELCQSWMRVKERLAKFALESLGIASEHPEDVASWLHKVHGKMQEDQSLDYLRTLILAATLEFAGEDVLIFISIINYHRDQDVLRAFAEQQLRLAPIQGCDPKVQKERVTEQLASAQSKLHNLENARDKELGDLSRELLAAQVELKRSASELDSLTIVTAEMRASTQGLKEQIDQLKHTLFEQEQRLRDKEGLKDKQLSSTLQLQQNVDDITARESAQRKQAEDNILEQSGLVRAIKSDLEAIEKSVCQPDIEVLPPLYVEMPTKQFEGIGNNAICYHGLQRTFRNAVVGFLRERLPRVFPTDHTSRLKKLFGDQWEKAEQNATKSREIGGTSTTVRDDYDLLGTNHFFEVFDRFFDKLFTVEVGQPLGLPKPTKSKFLGNLKAIKDGRDPLSHPVDEEISFEEAHHLLIEAKQILAWLGYEANAAELSALATRLDGGEIDSPTVVRRLPSEDSIYQEFVGRGEVLTDLAACFANPDSKRCLLAGDGGKGKSAVAYKFAQTLSSAPGRFQLILWLSAKRRKFQDGVSTLIDLPDFATAEEAIGRLLNEYGATAADLARPLEEKRRILIEFLNTLPAFIVADDIDTVLDDYEVVSLFTHEIPHTQSAVLLTSRRDIPGICSLILKEFDAKEAVDFVKSRIHLYGLDPKPYSLSVVTEIMKVTDGSPLYMDDLLRLTRILDVRSAIKMWGEKKGDAARKYALERELEKLTTEARRVLIAAAITDDPISFAELEGILALSEERLFSALRELQTLFLFPKPRIVEGEQRFQINLNTKKLVRLVEASSDLYARVERSSKALAGKLPDAGRGVIGSLIRQAHLRLNAGQPAEAEAILQEAIEKYPNATDLRGFLGHAYKRNGRIADARHHFEAASKMKGTKPEMFLHWIKMEILSQEWSKAVSVAERALKLHPEVYEIRERKIHAQLQTGFDFHRGLHREKAEKVWTEAVEEVKRSIRQPEALGSGDRQYSASIYRSMVISLDMLERGRERDQWLERWEREHPDDPNVARQKDILGNKRRRLRPGASW